MHYVMQSREIILKSNIWHFQFPIWLKCLLGEVHFAENPPELDQWLQSYEQFNDFQNNREKKFITTSGYISQSMLPTSRLILLDCNTHEYTLLDQVTKGYIA